MSLNFLADLLTALHMLCFAAGIGASLFLETLIVPRFFRSIERSDLTTLMQGHRLIELAVAGLWLTGFSILFVKTAIMGAPLTPKLAMKFVVVALLTFNMKMIAEHALPVLRHNCGKHLGVLTRYELQLLGAIAGLSAACWLAALGLGAISLFKALATWQLLLLFGPPLIAAPVIGSFLAPRMVDKARLGPRLALW